MFLAPTVYILSMLSSNERCNNGIKNNNKNTHKNTTNKHNKQTNTLVDFVHSFKMNVVYRLSIMSHFVKK